LDIALVRVNSPESTILSKCRGAWLPIGSWQQVELAGPVCVHKVSQVGAEQARIELQVVILERIGTAANLTVHLAQVSQVDQLYRSHPAPRGTLHCSNSLSFVNGGGVGMLERLELGKVWPPTQAEKSLAEPGSREYSGIDHDPTGWQLTGMLA